MSRVFNVDYIPDPRNGKPLRDAKVYIGNPNTDPTDPLNQISLTGDIGFPLGATINLTQPVYTDDSGMTVYNNSTVLIKAPEQNYAIQVFDRFDNLVYNFPNVTSVASKEYVNDYVTEYVSSYVNDYVNSAQEELLPPGSQIYPDDGSVLSNGMTVTTGTTHVRILISGEPTVVTMSPAASGLVGNITELGATIGITSVDFVNRDKRLILSALNVSMMIGGYTLDGQSIAHKVGQRWSSGIGQWEVTSVPVSSIDDFKPMSDVWIDDFGASRFGTLDSLAAINNALEVQGVVRGMLGTYRISDQILIDDDTRFIGAGEFATTIRPLQSFIDAANNGNGKQMIVNKNYNSNAFVAYNGNRDIEVSGMRFIYRDNNPIATDKINAIGFNNAKRILVKDCYGQNLGQHLVDLCGCEEVKVISCTSINGYWAQIQIDNANGLYAMSGYLLTHKCKDIMVDGNYLTGGKTNRGAIQIHKRGGNNITIQNNKIYGESYGITSDKYYVDTFDIEFNQSVKILNNYVDVALDALAIGKSLLSSSIKGNTFISASGYAMWLQAGDGTNKYFDRLSLLDNKCSGDIYMVGLRRSKIGINDFEGQTQPALISSKETKYFDNNMYIYGVIHSDITLTDPRDLQDFDYLLSNNKVVNNIGSAGGANVTFKVISTGFNLIEYIDNTYFSTATSHDFSQATIKSGFLINDYFRKSLRPSDPSTLPEPQAGQQAFYSVTGRPVWYNGTNWMYADDTIAI